MPSTNSTPRPRWRGWTAVVAWSATLLLASPSSSAPLMQIGAEVLDVSAKHLDVDLSRGVAKLEGEVRVKLGELDVSCDRVDIRYDDAPMVRWARGSGNVRAAIRGITATAQSLEVEIPERRAGLVGNVRISRGRGWVQADHATIDLPTGRITLDEIRGSIPIEARAK
jgi:lipopolysaccharide export system protein LptA